MQILIFLLLFSGVLANRVDFKEIKADNQEISCNFKDYNSEFPEAYPKISAPHKRGCGGQILSLRKILAELNDAGFNLYGAINVVDLLYSRTGQFELNWNNPNQVDEILNENICENHFKELLTEFETRKSGHAKINGQGSSRCIFNDIFAPDSESCPSAAYNRIKKSESSIFASQSEETSVVIQPGAGFCKAHWSTMVKQIEQNQPAADEKDATDQVTQKSEEKDATSSEESETPVSSEDEYLPDQPLDPETDKETIDAVNHLGSYIGVQRIVSQESFNDLSDRTKRDKVVVGKAVLKFFAAIMAPGAQEEFGAKICSIYQQPEKFENNPVNSILEAVSEQYQRAPDKITKQIVLGPVAATCNYREVHRYIPGLSWFLYNKARQCFNAEEIPVDLPVTFSRYDKHKIAVFVEFFTSPHCMVLMPYGHTTVTLSNGEKLDVAANIRMQSHKQIIRMYKKKMEEEKRENEVLPPSTMFAILEHCHAKKSKELTCVDYFLAAALDGFDVLKKIMDQWVTAEYLTVVESKTIKDQLKIGQEYLQTDFSISLKQHSEVVSHCINHALGDPTNDEFTNECDDHLTACPRCEALTKTLNNLNKRIGEMVLKCKRDNCEELEELEFKQIEIDYAIFNVFELRSHIVRSTWSEMERGKDISELDETKAYITFDWAHKYLPTKYRETQKDFFGKDGMSLHVTHAQTVDEEGNPVEHPFIHIIEQNKQDATAVIAIIVDVLKQLKAKGITSVILRSDNAGCYHSKEVILSLAEIRKQSGVEITKYSFSEPQNGKGNCDRIAALAKNKARRYVREGNNIIDENELYGALVADPGISYVTVALAKVKRVDSLIKTTALKGIATYYIFTPQNDGILVHRAANIGKGKLFKYNKANTKLDKLPSLEKSKEQTFGKIDNEDSWRSQKTRNRAKSTTDACNIFECHYEGCDETFSTYADYMIHAVFSKHGKINKMRDYVSVIYQDAVKQQKPSLNNLEQFLQSEKSIQNTIDKATSLDLGWGHKKLKKLPEVTEKAQEYVRKKFNEGSVSKAQKWKPKEVAEAMKSAKDDNNKRLFKPKEILFAEQIQSLFSKFASEQKKSTKAPKKSAKKSTEPPPKKQKTCEERITEIEEEGEDLESCMDDETRQNRYINIVTRARRLEIENEIEESFQSVLELAVDE